ncbi:MAG: extracellular solute-binding protein, partial [Oscillospiraceae bacterium]|nr:extracellular solute-binding protein [Oscillospiraceae bacterium]
MKTKKIICALLILSVVFLPVLLCFWSCGESGSGPKETAAKEGGDDGEQSGEADLADPKEKFSPNFEPVDMQGYVFKVGSRDDATHGYPAHTRDLFAESENGDLINDAVYRRNIAAEEKYNCKIEMDALPESDETAPNKIVEKSVKAGDKSYDLLMTHLMHGIATAVNGCTYDITDFPNIDLSKPYWSQGATQGLSISHKLYLGLSDLSFSTNENLYCMFFNKELIKNYGVENPYALLQENNWTFDKFNEIIRQGYLDLNGNGKADKEDQFGYITSSAMNFLWSGGSQIMKKDENDMPYLEYNTPKTINIFEKAFDITNNEFTFKTIEWFAEDPLNMFADGRGVFYSSQLCRVNDLRATEFDFGIIPYPKYDSAQERYYSYVDGHASMMAIPLNLP